MSQMHANLSRFFGPPLMRLAIPTEPVLNSFERFESPIYKAYVNRVFPPRIVSSFIFPTMSSKLSERRSNQRDDHEVSACARCFFSSIIAFLCSLADKCLSIALRVFLVDWLPIKVPSHSCPRPCVFLTDKAIFFSSSAIYVSVSKAS
jgi:hypothetical protein